MKNITFKILIAAGLLSAAGCDKGFENINIDPNALSPANMNYNYLLTGAQMFTAGNSDGNAYEDGSNNLFYCATMIQQLSSTYGYWNGDKYTYSPSANSAYWEMNYGNALKDIVEVVENTREKPEQVNLYNIARIFKAYQFQRITDMYGDLPYSEAGLGYYQGLTAPKYDLQKDIYADLLNELDDAATKLDPDATYIIGDADQVYYGDLDKWKKFAYSEMLRLAMRMSKVDPVAAKTWAAKAVAGGVFTSNDDNALLQHQDVGQTPVSNGVGRILDGIEAASGRVSKTLVDQLKNTHDPRLHFMTTVVYHYDPDPSKVTGPEVTEDKGDTTTAIQIGQPNGYDLSTGSTGISKAPNYPGDDKKYSVVNRYTFARLDAPTFFLTYSETALLMAEAAQRGWIDGDAETYYKEGVTGAILQLNQTGATLTEGEAATYLATNPFNAATALEQINTQYWICTYMDGYEAWANWRRSNYPTLTPVVFPNNATKGTIPRRFTYPNNEPSVNLTNYNEAVSRLENGDAMTSRVWWDTK